LTDALHHTLTDTTWRQQMERAAVARAATFTWRRTAEIVLASYESLL
jgi:hypothetical protein